MTLVSCLYQPPVDAPFGHLRLVASSEGLRAVLWPIDEDDGGRFDPGPWVEGTTPILDEATQQLDEYFTHRRTRFELALDPVGTEFQVAAWLALADVPYGETATYGQQAERLGRPKAMRAVGAANGRNPLSVILPCHRIVGADGSLTGFAGGLEAKRWLLDHELDHEGTGDGTARLPGM